MDARVFIHGSWLQITARKGTCQLKQPMNLQGKTFRVCWRYDTFMVNPPCPWEIDKTLGILAGANLTPKFSQFPWDISLCPSWLSQLQVAQSWHIPSGKLTKSYWKSPFLMGKLTISMVIFNSFLYVYQRVITTPGLPPSAKLPWGPTRSGHGTPAPRSSRWPRRRRRRCSLSRPRRSEPRWGLVVSMATIASGYD